MRWEDERYVRVFTRDTAELLALGWEARALLWEILRKVDRAGLLPLGRTGVRGVAGVTSIPLEVVERALPLLLEDGCVRQTATALVVPNFIDAQDTPQSDKARKREQRERDRAKALKSDEEVTKRDHESQNVTDSHAESRGVTYGHAESLRAVPCRAEDTYPASAGSEPPGSGNPAPHIPDQAPSPRGDQPAPAPLVLSPTPPSRPGLAEQVFAAYLEGWRRVVGGHRPPKLDDKRRKLIQARLRDFPLEDCIAAAAGIWRDAWSLEDPSKRISPEICFRDSTHIEKFRDAKGAVVTRNGRQVISEPAPGSNERAVAEFYRKTGLNGAA